MNEYKIDRKKKINIRLNKNVFVPNETTKLLINSLLKNLPKKKLSVLDLGCGSGVVGISLLKYKKNINHAYFSDISTEAISITKQNLQINKIPKKKYTIVVSDLFSRLKQKKFDIIINDVSGISNKIAKISPWFNNVPIESGADGTKLTINIFKNFSKYLKKNGFLISPIISLSNEKKIFNHLNKKKFKTKTLDSKRWPIPKEMTVHKRLLSKLKKEGKIDFVEQYNFLIATTKIIMVR
jgi:HemK-like putative methylase